MKDLVYLHDARMRSIVHLLPALHAQEYEFGANGSDFQLGAGTLIPLQRRSPLFHLLPHFRRRAPQRP